VAVELVVFLVVRVLVRRRRPQAQPTVLALTAGERFAVASREEGVSGASSDGDDSLISQGLNDTGGQPVHLVAVAKAAKGANARR
jgi:hypothetical protein